MPRVVPVCSVINCPNGDQYTVGSTVFYFVPTDTCRANRWGEILKGHIDDKTSFINVLICNKHFESDAFELNSKKLKPEAIPSIFPLALRQVKTERNIIKQEHQIENKNRDTLRKRKMTNITATTNKRMGSEIKEIDDKESNRQSENSLRVFTSSSSYKIEETLTDEEVNVKDEFSNLESNLSEEDVDFEIDKDRHDSSTEDLCSHFERGVKHLQALKQSLTEEHEELRKQERDLSLELAEVKEELKRKKAEQQTLPNAEIEVLKKCFSTAQIKMLTGNNKCRWSLDDLAVAYTISSLTSQAFYTYLRTNLKYPLPAVSNINRSLQSKNQNSNLQEKKS